MTLYELLAPDTHQFAITYDVTAIREGARFTRDRIDGRRRASPRKLPERSRRPVAGKDRRAEVTLKRGLVSIPLALCAQFHRAEHDREISYWLLDPAAHQFRISHDFTVSRPGQKYVHSFVRKGSKVSPDAKIYCLDTGTQLNTSNVSGQEVNALGYYPTPTDPDTVVVQGELEKALGEGESARVRVEETYNDPVGYTLKNGELVWERTLGRPFNRVTLPLGWILTSVNTPAIISLDSEGRVMLRFINTRNDELSVAIRARRSGR